VPEPVHPSLDTASLEALAESLARAVADNGGGGLVYVFARPDGPDVGILPLDGLAPADVLLGAVAPPGWAVLGVATGGSATHLVVLVARDGRVIRRARHGDDVITEPPASGATVDCLKRALGLPTAPPDDHSVDWARLRELAIVGDWPALGLTAEEAEWLDAGAFSRWVTGKERRLRIMPDASHVACSLSIGRQWDTL
jgi:hypothetical protein